MYTHVCEGIGTGYLGSLPWLPAEREAKTGEWTQDNYLEILLIPTVSCSIGRGFGCRNVPTLWALNPKPETVSVRSAKCSLLVLRIGVEVYEQEPQLTGAGWE